MKQAAAQSGELPSDQAVAIRLESPASLRLCSDRRRFSVAGRAASGGEPYHHSVSQYICISYGFFQFVQCSQGCAAHVNILGSVEQPFQWFYSAAVCKLLQKPHRPHNRRWLGMVEGDNELLHVGFRFPIAVDVSAATFAERVRAQAPLARPFSPRCGRRRSFCTSPCMKSHRRGDTQLTKNHFCRFQAITVTDSGWKTTNRH